MRRRLRVLLLAVLTLSGACTPVIAPAGPAVTAPKLAPDHILATDGARLPLRSWLPPASAKPKAIVLALHGFNDYANFFDAAGTYLASRGVAAFAYDQRGFGGAPNRGLWPGTASLTSDLRDASRLLRRKYPGVPLYLLGESMGGAVILVTMGGNAPADADGIILAAPAVWGRASMPWYQSVALWMAAHAMPGSAVTGQGLGIRPSDNTEMLIALGRDPMVIKETRIDAVFGLVNLMDQAMAAAPHVEVPALILYGERDQLVPPGAMAEMLKSLPPFPADQRRLAFYSDGFHMLLRDRQAEVVWADIVAWIGSRRAALPSGADQRAMAACPGHGVCDLTPSAAGRGEGPG